MAKKLTRADIQRDMLKRSATMEATILASGCCEFRKWVTVRQFIEAGMDKFECHCGACGTTYMNNGSFASYSSMSVKQATCPACGNANITTSRNPGQGERERKLFVEETDYGANFAIFYPTYSYPNTDDWRMAKPAHGINLIYYGMFHREYGWFIYNFRQEKLHKRDSQDEIYALQDIKRRTPENNDKLKGWSSLLLEAEQFEKERKDKNAARQAKSKVQLLDDMHANYRAKPIDEDKIAAASHRILYKVYSRDDKSTHYMACCTSCAGTYLVEGDGDMSCPHCGQTAVDRAYGRYGHTSGVSCNDTIVVYESTTLPENDLLIRVFDLKWTFDAANNLHRNIREKQRIFCGKKMCVYNDDGGKFKKATIRDITYELSSYHLSALSCQDDDEIAEAINSSCLVLSGLAESYGVGNKLYKSYEAAPNIKYLMAWYKNPSIELVLKSNMVRLTAYYVQHIDQLMDGTTLSEAVNVSPAVLKMLNKTDPTRDDLMQLNQLYRADQSITKEIYETIRNENLSANTLANLNLQHGISYAKAIQYLQSVYDHQCISKNDALHIWSDYLRMAAMLKIDLTDKNRKYPGSLKKEHDVAVFAYRSVQIEMDKAMFAKQAEINSFYEYSYKDFLVIIPKTPQDIIEEATRQKNCLRSYVESVKNGRTVVAFVRKKEEPDNAYITAEIHDGELVQLKGYCNSNPRGQIIDEFVEHWAKAKKFRLRYK